MLVATDISAILAKRNDKVLTFGQLRRKLVENDIYRKIGY